MTSRPDPRTTIKTYRHELKYFLNPAEFKILREIFAATMRLDSHCGPEKKYWIRSLYFDTVDNSDYYEKVIGVSVRKKIRLRIYDFGQKEAKLEIKNRQNQYMMKETAFLSRDEVKKMVRGERDFLIKSDNPILNRVYYLMSMDYYRPTVLIDYHRTAFLNPYQNIRVTFDTDLRANTIDFDLFGRRVNMIPVFEDEAVVMEVKYHRFLPGDIRSVLTNCHPSRQAISKYCLARVIY